MRILALDGALARCSAALWQDGTVLAEAMQDGARGHAATLPALARDVLRRAPDPDTRPDAVAVTVGPGGFTGLRAAIALAQGFAAGWGVPCIGVTVGEALLAAHTASGEARESATHVAEGVAAPQLFLPAAAFPPVTWTAVDTNRGRVALERPGEAPAVFALDDLPAAPPALLLGDAAPILAEALRARDDAPVILVGAALPEAAAVAAVAARRLAGLLPPLPGQEPLYLEPPAVRGG